MVNATVTPVFKKNSRMKVKNYPPVSILSKLSKIFERIMHHKMSLFFKGILSEYHFGFRKGHIAFDCLYLDLLIAKLYMPMVLTKMP